MADYTKDDALAFVGAIRLSLEGKVGFKWLVERLSDLSTYIESITAENDQRTAYIEGAGLSDEYEAYRAAHSAPGTPRDVDRHD